MSRRLWLLCTTVVFWPSVCAAQWGIPVTPAPPYTMIPSGIAVFAAPPAAYTAAVPVMVPQGVQPVAAVSEEDKQAGAVQKSCSCGRTCCPGGGWCYGWSVYAEFLYIRARDAEVAYAVEVNPAAGPSVPVGPVGVADMDYEPNWRAGFNYVLDEYSMVGARYTMFEADTRSRTDLTSGIIGTEIQGLLFHPGTAVANQGGVTANANYFVSFDLIDVDYRELIAYDCYYQTNFVFGGRYANLRQLLDSSVDINGFNTVETAIRFDGGGMRLGLESIRYSRRGFFAYGTAIGNVVVGDFRAKYDQRNQSDDSIVNTAWRAGRMVPILDLEFGVGWTSANGYWRFSTGYLYSAWFNVVKTDEFIDAVQANNFVGLSDTITFDGLVAKVEARF